MLARAGCTADVVGDGAQAVALLEVAALDYDLVLMDLRMPVMDGFEATRIAKEKLLLKAPVVAVTAESGFSTREKCVECGFDDVASKALKLNDLVSLLEKHLGAGAAKAPSTTETRLPQLAALCIGCE
jgi:CheY-like chemotaxis protein